MTVSEKNFTDIEPIKNKDYDADEVPRKKNDRA